MQQVYGPVLRIADGNDNGLIWAYADLFCRHDWMRQTLQRERAMKLLRCARMELHIGNFDRAEEFAVRAANLDSCYGLFDDQPCYLLVDLRKVRERSTNPPIAQTDEHRAAWHVLDNAAGAQPHGY